MHREGRRTSLVFAQGTAATQEACFEENNNRGKKSFYCDEEATIA